MITMSREAIIQQIRRQCDFCRAELERHDAMIEAGVRDLIDEQEYQHLLNMRSSYAHRYSELDLLLVTIGDT